MVLLAYLSPEALWDLHDFDFIDIELVPTKFVETVEQFLENSKFDTRCLFIISAIGNITKKNVRLKYRQIIINGIASNFNWRNIQSLKRKENIESGGHSY